MRARGGRGSVLRDVVRAVRAGHPHRRLLRGVPRVDTGRHGLLRGVLLRVYALAVAHLGLGDHTHRDRAVHGLHPGPGTAAQLSVLPVRQDDGYRGALCAVQGLLVLLIGTLLRCWCRETR